MQDLACPERKVEMLHPVCNGNVFTNRTHHELGD